MNTKAEIRLIAMDMDGTLLDPQGEISRKNIQALRKAQEKGICLSICSGRLPGDIRLTLEDAGLHDFYILSLNGAYCLEPGKAKPYAMHTFDREAAESCLRVLDDFQVSYGCFWGNKIAAIQHPQTMVKRHWAEHEQRPGAPEYFSGKQAVQDALLGGICKIIYMEDKDPERLRAIREKLLPVPGMDVTSSWINNLECMPLGVHKGSAVKGLAEHLGFSEENVMTLGDFDNDISMIEYAGFGIAMENATASVKRVAKHTTLSNAMDGVAEAIHRYAL